jgi:hypothetical protein
MARKLSGGLSGSPSVGALNVAPTAVVTAADNQDITLSPAGTGMLMVTANAQLQAQSDLRFADADSSNWVALQAPATVGSNVTWTLPATDGTNAQALTTNGSGVLSFVTPTVTISPQTSSSSTFYVPFTTTTSGGISTANIDNDTSLGLSFIPSTGTLSAGAGIFNGTVNSLRLENTKSAGHTLELADRDRVVNMNNGSAATVTIPNDSTVNFPVGSVVYINRTGAGTVTLAAAGGVTISKTGTLNTGEELICRKRAANNWIIVDTPTKLAASGGSVSFASGYTIHTYTSSGSFTI